MLNGSLHAIEYIINHIEYFVLIVLNKEVCVCVSSCVCVHVYIFRLRPRLWNLHPQLDKSGCVCGPDSALAIIYFSRITVHREVVQFKLHLWKWSEMVGGEITAACALVAKGQFLQTDVHITKFALICAVYQGQRLLLTMFALTVCSGFVTFVQSNKHIS